MSCKKALLSTLFLLSVGLTGLQAQQTHNAILATGGNASGNGGSVSYSVGQVVYTTNTGTSGSVIQGMQQAYEISDVTGIEEAEGITLQCSAYPNPTTNFLTLKVDGSTPLNIQSLSYQVYDMNGKLLEAKKIEGYQTSIVMGELVPATYFLKVLEGNKEVKTFKIFKN